MNALEVLACPPLGIERLMPPEARRQWHAKSHRQSRACWKGRAGVANPPAPPVHNTAQPVNTAPDGDKQGEGHMHTTSFCSGALIMQLALAAW